MEGIDAREMAKEVLSKEKSLRSNWIAKKRGNKGESVFNALQL